MNRSKIFNIAATCVMFVIMFIILLPVIFLIFTSLKPTVDVLATTSFIPRRLSLENYTSVLRSTPYLTWVMNSVIVALTVTVGATLIASMAAYAIARYKKKIKILDVTAKLLLLLQMFPLVLSLIPLYRTFLGMGIINTKLCLILANGTFNMPFSIWLLINFFDATPREIEESGAIDGCNRWQIFWKLVLPVGATGIISVAIIAFINCWNEFMMANIFIKGDKIKTLPLGITTFIQQFGSQWGLLMAASTMTLIPVAFFLVFTQKYLVQGLTAGSVKG